IFPFTFRFLGTYQVSTSVDNMINLSSYISTMLSMTMMMGVVFEIPMLCLLFARIGVLSSTTMTDYRKHAIVVILIAAAVITPTGDPFTLSLVSLPMWGLYELGLCLVKGVEKRRPKTA
ncbi:MAG: twin-arginine translocase subunit TatC, partial [Tidjanibacter sp.]|nr:twin-arginine translocase subunit TatC [Tidjanibacter sp.]